MFSELKGKIVPIKLWTKAEEVESSALDQLKNIAALPWVFHHVAVMPDVHYGKGATVGSVIAMKNALAPAAVGVDIGCGMQAVKTGFTASDLPDNLFGIRSAIEAAIPVGFNSHDRDRIAIIERTRREGEKLFGEFDWLDSSVADLRGRAEKQCGTLGGGNHFIEMCLDTEQNVWLMLHSGSRNIGKTLAEVHITKARKLAHNEMLPDRDLAVFLAGTLEMKAYRRDLFWAQRYATLNRDVMMLLLMDAVVKTFGRALTIEESISCHHN